MKKTLLISAISMLPLLVTACSTTTTNLYPKGGNKYQVVSLSRSANNAASASIKKATKTCQTSHKSLVVISNNTIYQGSGKVLGQVSQSLSDVAFASGGTLFGSTKSDSDYKNTLVFHCR